MPTEDDRLRQGKPLPEGAWDCHVHVFGEPAKFPFADGRPYTPSVALPSDAERMLDQLGARYCVLQQASPYGANNDCLLWALAEMADRAVGVIAWPGTDTCEAILTNRHYARLRGVRLHAGGEGGLFESAMEYLRHADALLRGSGWHADLHLGECRHDDLQGALDETRIPVVLDHFAGFPPVGGPLPPALLRLMDRDNVWLKISAPYRVRGLPPEAVADYVACLVDHFPDRCLWGSDWPHTPPHPQTDAGRLAARPFRPINTTVSAQLTLANLDERGQRSLLVTAPAALYGLIDA
jgi:predicted TIM-barrel fold metal-dependent hydrolase